MIPYDPDAPLLSLHVPKTAGTSLRLMMEQWFCRENMRLHYQDHRTLAPPPKYSLEGPICVHGHFDATRGYGVDQYYPEAKQFITFLRDPFDRAVSLYFFIRSHHLSRTPLDRIKRVFGQRADEAAFMPFERWIPFLIEEHLAGRSLSSSWHLPGGPDLQAIKTNMERRCVFIGVTERFDLSVAALSRLLRKTVRVPQHVNRTSRGAQDLSRWRSDYINAFTEEYELYELAVNLNAECLTA